MTFLDIDNNGLTDGVDSYQLFDNGLSIIVHNGNGRPISDDTSDSWNITQAQKDGDVFMVLLTGTNQQLGKYIVWTVDSSGSRISSTKWLFGKTMFQLGFNTLFNYDFNIAVQGVFDGNNDGLVDNVSGYQLFDSGSSVHLHDSNNNLYTTRTSDNWNAIEAVMVGDNFKVLLEGLNRQSGNYNILTTNSEGLRISDTGWRVGNWMNINSYDSIFTSEFKSTYQGVLDSNNDGLVDSVINYQLYNNGSSVLLHKGNGRFLSNSTTDLWNVTHSAKVNNNYRVLLTGLNAKTGLYNIWTTDSNGKFTSSTGWRTGNWLSINGFDSLFNVDLTNSTITELSTIRGESIDDFFGRAVAISSDGSRLAIGSSHDDNNGANSGRVVTYQWTGSNWQLLAPPIEGELAGDLHGYSLALSNDGNSLAIGSPLHNASARNNMYRRGRVKTYDWNGSSWVEFAEIYGERKDDQSGWSVDFSGDGQILAIGARMNDNPNGKNSGHVRVFSKQVNSWQQIGQDIDGEEYMDTSGTAISLSNDGTIIAIGAYLNDGNGYSNAQPGHVRVFEFSNSTWQQIGQDINGEAFGDFSGSYVDLSKDGKRLAIGALINDGNGNRSGHVRVYERDLSSDTWIQLGGDIDGQAAEDNFGRSPQFFNDGNNLIIGATRNDANGEDAGHAQIYRWDGTDWLQVGEDLTGSSAGDMVGFSIGISDDGSKIALGAPKPSSGAGFVKLFKASPSSLEEITDIDSDGLVDQGSNYRLFDSGFAIYLHRSNGKPISNSTSATWNVTNAAKVGDEFFVLLTGVNSQSGKYKVLITDQHGLITQDLGWKVDNWMNENGYDSIFGVNFSGAFSGAVDANGDGLVDGSVSYHLFDSGVGVPLHNHNGRMLSDETTNTWDVIESVKIGNTFNVLLKGTTSQHGRYKVLQTDANGLISSETGWKVGAWMSNSSYSSVFSSSFLDSLTGVADLDNDGLVDSQSNYLLYHSGSAVFLHDSQGRSLSDRSSVSWNATKSVFGDNVFKVLLTGLNSKAGEFLVYSADSTGLIASSTGFKNGDWLQQNSYETIFNIDFNNDQLIS